MATGAGARKERLGLVFLLSLVWLLFELGRPPTPPGLPLLIAAILFVDWLLRPDKQWTPNSWWWLILLGIIAIGIFAAPNTYSVYFYTRLMGILFLGICLPLQAMVTSTEKVRWWLLAFVGVTTFVGAWATAHSGFGPAANDGQDENYVATLMDMGIGVAYFMLFAEKRLFVRLLLCCSIVLGVGAMALASNPSRGGFLGLVAVAIYCLSRSPKKMLGLGILGLVGVSFLAIAGPSFWNEIETSTDYETGTGDVRIEVWKAGLRMYQANPVIGVGAGNFRWVIGDYQTAEQFEKFGRSLGGSIVAHSMHVEMLAELGTLGALATIMLVSTTWRGLGKVRQKRPGRETDAPPDLIRLSCYADALRAAMIGVLVSGAFLSLFYYSHLWVILAVGGAVPFVHRRLLRQLGMEETPSPRPKPMARGGARPTSLPAPVAGSPSSSR